MDEANPPARQFGATGPGWVVIKGGHLGGGDVIWHDGAVELPRLPWIETAK